MGQGSLELLTLYMYDTEVEAAVEAVGRVANGFIEQSLCGIPLVATQVDLCGNLKCGQWRRGTTERTEAAPQSVIQSSRTIERYG
ncbi:hypothetical protein GCM10008940_22050 [Microbulbifer agarilyticus]